MTTEQTVDNGVITNTNTPEQAAIIATLEQYSLEVKGEKAVTVSEWKLDDLAPIVSYKIGISKKQTDYVNLYVGTRRFVVSSEYRDGKAPARIPQNAILSLKVKSREGKFWLAIGW